MQAHGAAAAQPEEHQRPSEQLHAQAPPAEGGVEIQQADPAVSGVRAARWVEIQHSGDALAVVKAQHGLFVGTVMALGRGEIGLGRKALERAVSEAPGVGVAIRVKGLLRGGGEGLAPQGGGLFPALRREAVEMGAVVHRIDLPDAVVIKEMAYARVAADRKLRIVERAAQHMRQQAADRHAVADNGDGAAVVFAGDRLQRGGGAAAHVVIALGAGKAEFLGVMDKEIRLMGLVVIDVGEKARLPGPDIDLAQVENGVQLQRAEAPDRLGGEHRAAEVAGIERVDLHAAEARGERVDLEQAQGGDVAVPVTLHRAVEIALRLGVADQIDFCHNCVLPYLTMHAGMSIIQ